MIVASYSNRILGTLKISGTVIDRNVAKPVKPLVKSDGYKNRKIAITFVARIMSDGSKSGARPTPATGAGDHPPLKMRYKIP